MLYKTLNLFTPGVKIAVFLFFLCSFIAYPRSGETLFFVQTAPAVQTDSLLKAAHISYINEDYKAAITLYEKLLQQKHPDRVLILKNMALSHAALQQAKAAVNYAEAYIRSTADVNFPGNAAFKKIGDSERFKRLQKKYVPKLSIWSVLYLYAAIIGTFIAIVLQVKKYADRVANVLIGAFIGMHSLFIAHICLDLTHYSYYVPHVLFSTASFSLLYGPLLYFYFKRIIQHHRFKGTDILHLLPSIAYFVYMYPVYSLSGTEKLSLMMGEKEKMYPYLGVTVIAQCLSLFVYGYLIWRMYAAGRKAVFTEEKHLRWEKNMLGCYLLYTVSYNVYALIVGNAVTSGFLYHLQIAILCLLGLYAGYMAYIQPEIFSSVIATKNGVLFKYKKSGLTKTYSRELKENLLKLLREEKIYRDNNMNLEMLSEKLGTTRHNTSQVINEHFEVNFFELINKYRIKEALDILKNDNRRNFNIIDVAYEVGFNNKVTFNKAFKKETSLTPTQYMERLAREEFGLG